MQQTLFNAAITMWEGIIEANGGAGNFTITPLYTALSGLGLANQFTQNASGIPISGRVSIDSGTTWFVDATPFDTAEYDAVAGDQFSFTNGQGNTANFDMLTVILQEIAHVLGWTISYSNFSALVSSGPGNLRTFDNGNCFPSARVGHLGDLI